MSADVVVESVDEGTTVWFRLAAARTHNSYVDSLAGLLGGAEGLAGQHELAVTHLGDSD